MDTQTQLKEKILSLQTALLESHPTMPGLLREIHTTLKANPDCVTLLSDDEVGVIVSGLKKQTATEIATSALKTKTKAVKSMTLADL